MKLSKQTHGPVTLSKIDYSPSLSEETCAFVAEVSIKIDGVVHKSRVRNEGYGGDNFIEGSTVSKAVDEYAKTLPPLQDLEMDADLLISEMMAEALYADDLKKALRRNFLYQGTDGNLYEIKKAKGKEEQHKAHLLRQKPECQLLNDMPFDQALQLYKAVGA